VGFCLLLWHIAIGVYETKPDYWQAIWLLPCTLAAASVFYLAAGHFSASIFMCIPFAAWCLFWFSFQILGQQKIAQSFLSTLFSFLLSVGFGTLVIHLFFLRDTTKRKQDSPQAGEALHSKR